MWVCISLSAWVQITKSVLCGFVLRVDRSNVSFCQSDLTLIVRLFVSQPVVSEWMRSRLHTVTQGDFPNHETDG